VTIPDDDLGSRPEDPPPPGGGDADADVDVDVGTLVGRSATDLRFDIAGSNDRSLVALIALGEPAALAEVYRRHHPHVHGLAYRMCGQDGADDVVQDVFLRLWQKPGRYNPDRGPLRSFLALEAHGRAIDSLRRDGAQRARDAADRRQSAMNVEVEVEATALARLAGNEVTQALAVLPDHERLVIVLAYFGGHTYREVAGIVRQPEGTVKSWIRSGLARLRGELAV
jgi:RNA polymerase sigma-70 factor (ECF subfamily)